MHSLSLEESAGGGASPDRMRCGGRIARLADRRDRPEDVGPRGTGVDAFQLRPTASAPFRWNRHPHSRRLLFLVQGGRAGLDRRRARSRLNAGADGCPIDAPSPGISSGGSCGTLHALRRPDVRPVREKCGNGFGLRDLMGLPHGRLGAGALLGVARRSQSVRTACRSSSTTVICRVTTASPARSLWLGDRVDLGGDALGEGLGLGQERVVA
jgi:hypothetical protein